MTSEGDSKELVRTVCEEATPPVSAYKAMLAAKEEQMKVILNCYMAHPDLVTHLKANSVSMLSEFSSDIGESDRLSMSDGFVSLYDHYVEYIREIEEDDHQSYGQGYFSMYGTRQYARRAIIDDLRKFSWKFKVKVRAPLMKTVGRAGR